MDNTSTTADRVRIESLGLKVEHDGKSLVLEEDGADDDANDFMRIDMYLTFQSICAQLRAFKERHRFRH